MLRAMLLNPLMVALSAAAGVALCRLAHIDPHLNQMLIAAIVALVAAEISLAPVLVSRKAAIATLAQAAFAGMVIHMGLSIVLAVVVFLAMHMGQPFGYWTLLFFWTTLPVVSVVFIRFIRAAAPVSKAVNGI